MKNQLILEAVRCNVSTPKHAQSVVYSQF